MLTMDAMLEMMTGDQAVDSLVEMMELRFPDFSQDRRLYLQAMEKLAAQLGPDAESLVREDMDAMKKQTVSFLVHAGMYGFLDNLEHFKNPTAGCFLDTDPEVFTRERDAQLLPAYQQAAAVRERFYRRLSAVQRELYTYAIGYEAHLLTVIPKLAHYYGYVLANTLLERSVPGYLPDPVQTMRYRSMLNQFFGCPVV